MVGQADHGQRAVQDEDLEYAPSADGMGKEAVARPVLAIDDEATGQLRDFYEQCTRMADGEISEHEESWWVRAPELTARVAATLAMAQWHGRPMPSTKSLAWRWLGLGPWPRLSNSSVGMAGSCTE